MMTVSSVGGNHRTTYKGRFRGRQPADQVGDLLRLSGTPQGRLFIHISFHFITDILAVTIDKVTAQFRLHISRSDRYHPYS